MNDDYKDSDFIRSKQRCLAIAKEMIAEGADPKAVCLGMYWAGSHSSMHHSIDTHMCYMLAVMENSTKCWKTMEDKMVERLADPITA